MEHAAYPAFHVLWTKPSIADGKDFAMNEAEILTMIVSALMWQKYNGTIKLFTDHTGYEFIKEHDLLNLWDGGINTEVLENNSYPINPGVFWAAGKLLAMEAQNCPCVMLDTDLIIMRPINEVLKNSDVTALHKENPDPQVYLDPSLLQLPENFSFPDYYNWNIAPSNTAFLYIKNEEFKQFYLNESKQFMFHNTGKPAELVSQMVFAEQRLLSICADRADLPVNYLLTDPFSLSNKNVVHLWGFKNLLRQNDKIQKIYSKQLIKTVKDELSTNLFFQNYLAKHQ